VTTTKGTKCTKESHDDRLRLFVLFVTFVVAGVLEKGAETNSADYTTGRLAIDSSLFQHSGPQNRGHTDQDL
jgi:hypothetical protein